MTITGSAVGQFLSEIAIRHRDTILSENLHLLNTNIEHFVAFASRQQHRLFINMPKASTTTLVQFDETIDVESLALHAFESHSILIAPGNKFGNYPRWARIGFGGHTFEVTS